MVAAKAKVKVKADGSAGDTDYGAVGAVCSRYRRTEPQIAARIVAALGGAKHVLNVGAGAGSYEPHDRAVTAVEPSASMRAQRDRSLPPAIAAVAEALPFPDQFFDASMATFTVHQWSNLGLGIGELRRVTRGPVVILTCDPDRVEQFWLSTYAPEVLAKERRRYPPIDELVRLLDGNAEVLEVPIPHGCIDGFNEAYYGRPEALLDANARLSNSAWGFVAKEIAAGYVETLARALADGSWDDRHGALRTTPAFNGSLRLLVATPA